MSKAIDKVSETVARGLHATGKRIAGERGGRVANAIGDAIGVGHVEPCTGPGCQLCAEDATAR